jgi:molybdopterin-guanine dinucleotide biosynthesis protein B
MGSKNAGKTTVAEFLVERFVRDGLRVGAVKHIHHEFTMDTQGKDTWRLSRKGASIVASISPNEMAVMFYRFTGWNSSFETLKKYWMMRWMCSLQRASTCCLGRMRMFTRF